MSKLIVYLSVALLISVKAYSDELSCNDVIVSEDGYAWNLSGDLVTDVVFCESENRTMRTEYRNGRKHGKEYITDKETEGLEWVITYSNGSEVQSCLTQKLSTGQLKRSCQKP